MKYVIDRFEGEFAVIETDSGTVDMPKCLLPKETCEGSIIEINVLEQETKEQKEKMQERLNNLFRKKE